MPGLLLLAHAPLAGALRAVAGHAFPECVEGLQALDVPPDWSAEQVEAELRRLLADQAETLILTDVFGATPTNVAQRLADGTHVRVVTGVNVPMLWRALCYRHEPMESLVARATAGGAQGVMPVSLPRPQNQTLDTTHTHAATHAHHQQ